jgi:hypothetical protein
MNTNEIYRNTKCRHCRTLIKEFYSKYLKEAEYPCSFDKFMEEYATDERDWNGDKAQDTMNRLLSDEQITINENHLYNL